MKRVIWHWTAGSHSPSREDRAAYHFLIDGAGNIHDGDHSPAANAVIRNGVPYAAHTRGCNTGSIGIALCAMHGAVQRPFSPGRYPITPTQVGALVALTGRLCREYGVIVTERTVLSHAEVQPTLGIVQRGKWDISWLPDMDAPGSPVIVGDRLRSQVLAWMQDAEPPPPPKPTLWERFANLSWRDW